jgi:hypothetical protein
MLIQITDGAWLETDSIVGIAVHQTVLGGGDTPWRVGIAAGSHSHTLSFSTKQEAEKYRDELANLVNERRKYA